MFGVLCTECTIPHRLLLKEDVFYLTYGYKYCKNCGKQHYSVTILLVIDVSLN